MAFGKTGRGGCSMLELSKKKKKLNQSRGAVRRKAAAGAGAGPRCHHPRHKIHHQRVHEVRSLVVGAVVRAAGRRHPGLLHR